MDPALTQLKSDRGHQHRGLHHDACRLTPAVKIASELFAAFDRIADEPNGRWPQTDEQGATFGIPAFVLVNGLGANPQANAQSNGAHREQLQVPAAQARAVEAVNQHVPSLAAG
jgi:hypothetical protein